MSRGKAKRWLARIAIGFVVLLVVLLGVPTAVGSLMPREHVASSDALLKASPAQVWEAVAAFEEMPKWMPDFERVERLPDVEGKPSFRMLSDGQELTFIFREVVQPKRLVVGLADPQGYFGGVWTYVLTPEAGGTRLEITEAGWAGPGFFRFMIWLFGADATIKQYLAALQKKLG